MDVYEYIYLCVGGMCVDERGNVFTPFPKSILGISPSEPYRDFILRNN
jgi:hypothetical protein